MTTRRRPSSMPRSPALLGLFAAMITLSVLALAGLALDPREITGAPAWLKPLKFALSTAIYALSFSWLLDQMTAAPAVKRWLAGITTAVFGVELSLIFLQAARGAASHFNLDGPFNTHVYDVMGAAIVVLWLVQLCTAALLLRQRFEDPALGWALRAGMILTALGAAVGVLMVLPTAGQLASYRNGVMLLRGAHTIGAPDGGPGLPFTNWSALHGDLRVAHFFGLHALQLLPLTALLLRRLPGLSLQRQARLVQVAAGSALGLFAILLWQALRGQPLVQPDAWTLSAACAWACCTAIAASVPRPGPRAAPVLS